MLLLIKHTLSLIAIASAAVLQSSEPGIKDLTWGDVNFLHTTDTHGWYAGHLNQKQYSGDWGDFISFTTHIRKIAEANGQDILLIDTGDRHDGNGLSDITTPNGIKSTPIFIKQEYDLLTIGNHELYVWENSKQEFESIVKHFPDQYVCSNVEYKLENGTFVPFAQRHRYFTTKVQQKRVLAFGFLFDFKRFNSGTKVTSIKDVIDHDPWFNDTLNQFPEDQVDLIVIAGHTPIDYSWPEFYYLNSRLREFYPNTIIQYFGGHSHIRDFSVFDDKATGLQSGRYCETVGWVSIDLETESDDVRDRFSRLYIDFNRKSFLHHSKEDEGFDTEKGKEVTKLIRRTRKELELNKPISHIENNYYVDFVPITHKRSIFSLLTNDVLFTLRPDNGSLSDDRIVLINTGSIRYDMYKGPYTIDSKYIISPFENVWTSIIVPKSIAVQVASKLNEMGYILLNEGSFLNNELLPPHQRSPRTRLQKKDQVPFEFPESSRTKLSKGYVTHDDFGSDGDDTPHTGVVHFQVPSVVESVQFTNAEVGDVEVVFYDFITPNVLGAVRELGYAISKNDVRAYSGSFLGDLLTEYVTKNRV